MGGGFALGWWMGGFLPRYLRMSGGAGAGGDGLLVHVLAEQFSLLLHLAPEACSRRDVRYCCRCRR